MTPEPDKKPLLLRIQLALAAGRYLTFSTLLHVILVIAAGGIVLFQHVAEQPDFEAGEGSLVSEDSTGGTQPPEETQTMQTPVMMQAPTPQVSTPAMAAIMTVNASATFALPSAPAARLSGNLTGMGDAGKAIGDKLAGMGATAGRAGGMGSMMRFFGNKEKTVPSLVGTFYDLKQTRVKKPTGISPDEYHKVFRTFVAEGWRESILNDYFRAPKPLYSTQIMIPNMSADEGPKAFGMEKEVQPSRWLVHYKGKVSPPADGTYHFVGAGDDVMVVRFNGKVVLDRCWYQHGQTWMPEKNYDYGWTGIPNGFAKGDPIRVRAGQYYDLEVLIGEQPGGLVFACLLMEKEGAKYEQDGKGNPILPVFRLADEAMPELQDGQTLPPYQANGPVWKARAPGGSGFDDLFGKKPM